VTRKDFILVAGAIREARSLIDPKDGPILDRTAELLADRFKATNPLFERERFLKACGVGEKKP
jgi:hypothetical protein